MLEEQYRRSEKVRLKNKQQERLLQHEIESRRGMRDVHRYRLEIVNREQKEISRELDRIRMGIKRNLNMSPNWSDSTRQNLDGVGKANQAHNKPKANFTPRRSQCTKLKSLSLNLSRRQLMSLEDAVGSVNDETDGLIKMNSEEEDDKEKDDDSDKNSSSDRYSSFDDEEESIPDPDILKAIMDSIVCDWEQSVIRTISSNQNHTNKKISLGVKTSKYRRDNDLSPYSNATESITPRRSLAWNSERDSNLKPPSDPMSGRKPLSISNDHHEDRRNNWPFIKRRCSGPPSAIPPKQTAGKQKGTQFYDTRDRNKDKSLGKHPNQLTRHTLDTRATVAGRENVTKPTVVNQVPASCYRETETDHQSGLRNQKEETRAISEDEKNYGLFKNKLPTLEKKVGDRKGTTVLGAISTKKMPTEWASYSARDNSMDANRSFKENIDTALSSRSDGYRAMRNDGRFRNDMKISSNYESMDNSESFECHHAELNPALRRKINLKEETEPSSPATHENAGKSRPGNSKTGMAKGTEGRNDREEKGSGRFIDKSFYKNPKLHIFKKGAG